MPAGVLAAEIPSFPERFHSSTTIFAGAAKPIVSPAKRFPGLKTMIQAGVPAATLDPKYPEGLDFIALR